MKTELYEEALIYSEKSIEINPNNYNVYNNLGYVYFGMDDLDKAIECWEKSLELNPEYAYAWHSLGE